MSAAVETLQADRARIRYEEAYRACWEDMNRKCGHLPAKIKLCEADIGRMQSSPPEQQMDATRVDDAIDRLILGALSQEWQSSRQIQRQIQDNGHIPPSVRSIGSRMVRFRKDGRAENRHAKGNGKNGPTWTEWRKA